MTLVDSCVLIDVIDEDVRWGLPSGRLMARALGRGELVVDPVILAELHGRARTSAKLAEVLDLYEVRVLSVPPEISPIAGAAFRRYRERGGRTGAMLADFLIGAHATLLKATLLTRDRARFAGYFPDLAIIAPEPDAP